MTLRPENDRSVERVCRMNTIADHKHTHAYASGLVNELAVEYGTVGNSNACRNGVPSNLNIIHGKTVRILKPTEQQILIKRKTQCVLFEQPPTVGTTTTGTAAGSTSVPIDPCYPTVTVESVSRACSNTMWSKFSVHMVAVLVLNISPTRCYP